MARAEGQSKTLGIDARPQPRFGRYAQPKAGPV
jgi:hypothetical protein